MDSQRKTKDISFNKNKIVNNKTNVVLISLQADRGPSYPLLYLDTYLNKAGINAELLFPNVLSVTVKDLVQRVAELNPKIVGIGAMFHDRRQAKNIVEALAPYRKNFKIVLGGYMSSPLPEYMLKKLDADIVVVNEGEITFTKLAENILGGADYSGTKGIVIWENGEIINTGPGDFIKDLNEIPPLNYDKFPMEKFLNVYKVFKTMPRNHLYNKLSRPGFIYSGRGCPYVCNFCYQPYKVRLVSLTNVIGQIKEFQDRYNINMISFADDLALLNKKRAMDLSKAMINANINLPFTIQAHFNSVDEEVLVALKESGCIQIAFGLESGSQKILDRIDKKLKLEQVRSIIGLLNKHGINWNGALQIGQVDETEDDVQKTIDFYKPYVGNNSTIGFCITTPYPGTPIFEKCLKSGLIKSYDEAYDKITDPRYLSYNLSKMPDWKIRYLRIKLPVIFDLKKLSSIHGVLKGSLLFIKALLLKLHSKMKLSFSS